MYPRASLTTLNKLGFVYTATHPKFSPMFVPKDSPRPISQKYKNLVSEGARKACQAASDWRLSTRRVAAATVDVPAAFWAVFSQSTNSFINVGDYELCIPETWLRPVRQLNRGSLQTGGGPDGWSGIHFLFRRYRHNYRRHPQQLW